MKKLINLILLVSLLQVCKVSSSQITGGSQVIDLRPILVVNTFIPANLRYEDTWKANITNPGAPLSIYAELGITKNNRPYLKAISDKFILSQGITAIDFNKITLVQVTLNSQNQVWNQFLTFGQYEICIRIYNSEGEIKAEACTPVEILPISIPSIIGPEDQSEVGLNPIFTWSPPQPLNIFKSVSYELRIVPIYPGQSSYEAMSRNYAILNEPNIYALSYIYNVTSMPLENEKEYAWQITAKDETVEIGKSEVQTIKVNEHKEKPKEVLIPKYYYKLRKTEDGNFGVAKGCLGFTCEDEKLDSNMKFKIYDAKYKEVLCSDNLKIQMIGNENYFILELANCNEFKAMETYRLEVVSPSNKKYLIYFKYSEPETK